MLFHFPYPATLLFATLTKTAGCTTKVPNLELSTRHLQPATVVQPFVFILLRTFLRSRKTQLFSFQPFAHSCKKSLGVGEGA